jgi:hypothetical protein
MDSTTICNLALAKIGDLSILSLDDPTPEARFAKLFYTPTKEELLRLHNWNWATSHSKLSPITPDPLYDWDYAFGLPVDFGRMLTFNSFSPAMPVTPYQIVGNQLYTDDSEAVISYIRKITDENQFDPLFVDALVYRIAAKLARPLAGSLDIEKMNNLSFEKALAEARRIDAGEGSPRRKMQWVDSDLVRSRYTGVV